MRARSRTISLAICLVLALGACGGDDDDDAEASASTDKESGEVAKPDGGGSGEGKTLELGAVFSLTGPGAIIGPQQKQAVELAAEVINAAGGVDGAKIKLTVVDDASDKAKAAQLTQTLIQDGAVAIIGPSLSNSAPAAHPIAANAKTPMMPISNTGLDIVGPGCTYCNGWIFRASLGDEIAVPANLKVYADEKHPKKMALLFANDDKYSSDGAKMVKDSAAKLGITLTDTIEFTKGETDLTPYATKAAQGNPDVMWLSCLGGLPAKIMHITRDLGYKGDFLGGNSFNAPAESAQAAAAGKGSRSGAAWFRKSDDPANNELLGKFKAKYGTDPDQFVAQGWTAVHVMADAAKRAKLSYDDVGADRAAMREALAATSLDSTPLGPFKFNSDNDVSQKIWIQAMDGTGGFELVTTVEPSVG